MLLGDSFTENLKKNFLELVALATLADMMPKEDENKFFIEEGLKSLENSWRPAIKVFFQSKSFEKGENLHQKVFKIISLLNVRNLENRLPVAFRLLTTSSEGEAEKIIEILLEKRIQRKEEIEDLTKELEKMIGKTGDGPIIFQGGSNWGFSLLSPVASIICHNYQKPTFLFKKEEKESQGAVRMPEGFNGVEAMKKCSKLLETYGGHPMAAGFRIKNENLEKFKECLIKYFSKYAN